MHRQYFYSTQGNLAQDTHLQSPYTAIRRSPCPLCSTLFQNTRILMHLLRQALSFVLRLLSSARMPRRSGINSTFRHNTSGGWHSSGRVSHLCQSRTQPGFYAEFPWPPNRLLISYHVDIIMSLDIQTKSRWCEVTLTKTGQPRGEPISMWGTSIILIFQVGPQKGRNLCHL